MCSDVSNVPPLRRLALVRLLDSCAVVLVFFSFFFFQAEDGIRDYKVTGVRRVLFRSHHNLSKPCFKTHPDVQFFVGMSKCDNFPFHVLLIDRKSVV